MASLLLLGIYFFTGTFTGTRLTPPYHFGLYQSSVELGLLPALRNKSVNLGVLKLIWSDCSVLPVKTKPWWQHMHCYMSLLTFFTSTFTALLVTFLLMASLCFPMALLQLECHGFVLLPPPWQGFTKTPGKDISSA